LLAVDARKLRSSNADYTSVSRSITLSPHHHIVDLSLFEDSVSRKPPPP
jgi:hypothetical protein